MNFGIFGGVDVLMLWGDGVKADPLNARNYVPTAHAYKCAVSPCIYEFSANISNGQLFETTISRTMVEDWLVNQGLVDTACLDASAVQDMEDLGYSVLDRRYVFFDININPHYPEAAIGHYMYNKIRDTSQSPAAINKGFYIGNSSEWTLSEAGRRVVPSRYIFQINNMVEYSRASTWSKNYFTGNVNTGTGYDMGGSIVPRSFYMLGRNYSMAGQSLEAISGVMQNITDTMTTYIRWHGNKNMSEPAQGEAHRYAVCVAVRWGYIAYSGGIIFSLFIFLPMMIINTRSAGSRDKQHGDPFDLPQQHDFKSSALAVLFHELESQENDQRGEVRNMEYLSGTRRRIQKSHGQDGHNQEWVEARKK